MMIQILEGDKDNVDFEEPVEMTKDQLDRFVEMLEAIFAEDVVKVERSNEIRRDRLGDKKRFQREWTAIEREYIFEFDDNHEIAEKLGRSPMSIMAQRAKFLPDFKKWVSMKGYDMLRDNLKKMIEEYMEEKELKKQERKNLRKERRNLEDEIEDIENRNSELKEKIKREPPEEMKKDMKNKIEENKKRITSLEDRIEEIEDELKELR